MNEIIDSLSSYLKNSINQNNLSFSDWVIDRYKNKNFQDYKRMYSDYTHWIDKDNTDFILRFENLSSDFNNKRNLKSWLNKIPLSQAKEYCRDLLVKRKKEKGLIYSLTEVELRTLPIPPIHFYEKLFGSYYSLCEEIGYKNKFQKVPTKKKLQRNFQ